MQLYIVCIILFGFEIAYLTLEWLHANLLPQEREFREVFTILLISFIIQYFRHPHQLPIICSRLQHPALEIIVHLDSDEPDDAAALELAQRRFANVRELRSSNVHEIRGYNRAASAARGALLAFSQDDRLPPASVGWVDAVAAGMKS